LAGEAIRHRIFVFRFEGKVSMETRAAHSGQTPESSGADHIRPCDYMWSRFALRGHAPCFLHSNPQVIRLAGSTLAITAVRGPRRTTSLAKKVQLKGGSLTLAKKEAAKQKEAPEKKDTGKKETAAVIAGGEAPVAAAKPSTKSVKVGKLLPKNKSRLPRRQKKARQKAAGRL
jgi:hypothetical protein